MLRPAPIPALLAAALSAAGCSRTYDGTVVPTYRMAVDRYAGIPVLTMQRTPLEEPRAAAALAAFPPPPAAAPVETSPQAQPQPQAQPRAEAQAKPRPRRTAMRQAAPPLPPAADKTLLCRNRESGERAVSMVCE